MQAVSVKNLNFTYPKPPALFLYLMGGKARSVQALKEINFTISPGEKISLMGKNGAGKTTLLKIIMGLLHHQVNSVEVFGKSPFSGETRKMIGFAQSDERSFYHRLSVQENLFFFGGIWGLSESVLKERIFTISEELNLKDFINEPFSQLSSGMKQRVSIGRALLNDPPLLLLDEPTRSLDIIAQDELRSLLKGHLFKDKTIITATHKIEEAQEISQRCIILKEGKVVYDGVPFEKEEKFFELMGKEERCQ
ncbi:MAG: ABC transporter ATP-binding protein [Thermoanaerobaculaceae bacterium]|nr:ABC transporter ATP-binding protein [Thermoanaerobaculaceae bacterium]